MYQKKNKKVIVAMSGGVDSSVSAWLLNNKGYQVEGLFMKNWEEDDTREHCNAAADLADAQEVCNQLGIKLHKINFSAEFWNNVFENFLIEYKKGNTPNPDILCNKEIKFKTFMKFAIQQLKADYIATGHYVRSKIIDGQKKLLRGSDKNKDQSYFLYTLSYKQLNYILFPLGEKQKIEVRKIAKKLNLINATKKDSTGICFIGKRKFRDFLKKYIPINPGAIKTIDGKIIGLHYGVPYYTLGQRQGLRIGGLKEKKNNPWYVIDKDIEHNILIADQNPQHPKLISQGLIANQLHWVDRKTLTQVRWCTIKTRYRQTDVPCKVIPINNDLVKVNFNIPLAAVSPGQSAVFYANEICLGGGIIKNIFLSN